jgi:hypothetical protein
VWDRVSAVSKAPVDNKSCLFAALTKVMAVMKDTVREVRPEARDLNPEPETWKVKRWREGSRRSISRCRSTCWHSAAEPVHAARQLPFDSDTTMNCFTAHLTFPKHKLCCFWRF